MSCLCRAAEEAGGAAEGCSSHGGGGLSTEPRSASVTASSVFYCSCVDRIILHVQLKFARMTKATWLSGSFCLKEICVQMYLYRFVFCTLSRPSLGCLIRYREEFWQCLPHFQSPGWRLKWQDKCEFEAMTCLQCHIVLHNKHFSSTSKFFSPNLWNMNFH